MAKQPTSKKPVSDAPDTLTVPNANPEPKKAQTVEQCSNCRYLRNKEECHFKPPEIWFPYYGQPGMHPRVTPSGWCGQWKAKAD